jgi:primosomal replication protein N
MARPSSTSTGTRPAGLTLRTSFLKRESPSKESKRTRCSWNGMPACVSSTQGRIDQDE